MVRMCHHAACCMPCWPGRRVSGSHANPLALKTDAPPGVLWDIIRCWVKDHPAPAALKDPQSYSAKILSKEPTLTANFSRVAGAMPKAKTDNVPRCVCTRMAARHQAAHGLGC